jgi:hypothetical protein
MNQYKVTFKRIEAFYQSIFVEASTKDEAYMQADQLSDNGTIEFDCFKESDILEEYICNIEPL